MNRGAAKGSAGIVLAAGASSRMGRPKALLPLPDGTPLALHQVRLLRAAGCSRTLVVLGADATAIAHHLAGCDVVVNEDWARGRFTSIQAGLRALAGCAGYLLLPVDTAGVRRQTLAAVLREAETRQPLALRPCHGGKPGRVLWLSDALAQDLLRQPAQDARLDERLADVAMRLEVEDPALLHNVNTPAEWEAVRDALR